MTNREFYKDKLLDIVCAGDCFGVNKINSQPVPCGELHCGKCVFSISDSCIKNRVAWCNKKYIKRLKLTENEKKFLDILNPDMKYIARDKDLRLFVFKEKPKKRGNTWGEIIAFDEYINEKHFKRMFEFIKWEDEEPWLIDDLRKLEVEKGRRIMTLKELFKQGKLQLEVEPIKRCSSIDIDFLTNDGKEDEVQLNITKNILTRAGKEELEELFDSLTKEFNTKSNRILSCTVVASADTEEELIQMGY